MPISRSKVISFESYHLGRQWTHIPDRMLYMPNKVVSSKHLQQQKLNIRSEPVEAILSHVGNKLAFTDDLYNATQSFTGRTAQDLIAAAQSTLYICTKHLLHGYKEHSVYTQGDREVISSYHIYANCFPPFCGASSAKCCYSDMTFIVK